MSDILQAVSRRSQAGVPEVDVVALSDARLFPPPAEAQRNEFIKLATRLLELREGRPGFVIAFAGNVSAEGASFVSYNLARILAASLGRRTLWIDANFLAPNPVLSLREDDTFAGLLRDPEEVNRRRVDGGLTLMPAGVGLAALKPEIADNSRVVFDGLRNQYDFVIVDCPPVLEAVETAWLGAAADGLAVVVEARRLKSPIIKHGLRVLAEQKVNVLGTVLNRRRFDLPKIIYDRL